MSYSTYNTDVIALDFGLDLTTPKPVAPSGTLSGCLNYEITDRVGLKRIDGFERFDGRLGGGCETFWEIGHSGGMYVQGSIVAARFLDSPVLTYSILGVVVEVISSGVFRMAVLNDLILPVIRDADGLVTEMAATQVRLATVDPLTKQVTDHSPPSFVRDIRYAVPSPQSQQESIRQYQSYLRSSVSALSSAPVMAATYQSVHYAASGAKRMVVTSPGTINITSVPGTLIGCTGSGVTAVVTKVVNQGTSASVYYQDVSGVYASASGTVTGLSGTANSAAITNSTFPVGTFGASNDCAEIFFCADEQTEFDRFFGIRQGWRRLDMGWEFSFSNGSNPSLPGKFDRGLGIGSQTNYWISNGTTTFSCELNSYSIASGTFQAGTAAGRMSISALALVAGTYAAPSTGWAIYRAASIIPANKLADVVSPMTYNYLPGVSELLAARSMYQVRDKNFYATDGLGLLFGVSGASRAFYFNTDRFSFITTSPSETSNPRHLGFISNSLALGYADGRVQVSVPGEPWNYSGVDGGYEYGAGYPVRGLLQMQGDTIGVFTSSGVFAIQGTSQDNYVGRTLVPNIGTVEYTVVSVGDAVFVSPAGIVALSQSEKYGDFVGSPISFKINPLLRPLARKAGSIVAALPVRNKNQYRLYCLDGTIFTMTFREGKMAEATTQRYFVTRGNLEDARGKFVVPLALSSVLDEDGQESLLFSHFSPNSRAQTSFMYKLDSGWGFDGTSMPAFFDVNWYFADQPFVNKVLRKVRIDGESRGSASINLRTAADYLPTYSRPVEGNLPQDRQYLSSLDRPYSTMVNVEERGLNVAVKAEHVTEFSAPEPPHTLQTLFIQFTGAKTDA